jgi:hypothetical protein
VLCGENERNVHYLQEYGKFIQNKIYVLIKNGHNKSPIEFLDFKEGFR